MISMLREVDERIVLTLSQREHGVRELITELRTSPNSVVQNLRQLERARLVRAKPGEGRAKVVSLTPRGKRVATRLIEIARSVPLF